MSVSMATLKDGSMVPEQTVATLTLSLKSVFKENYIAFFDLIEKCKDSSYHFTANPSNCDSKAFLKEWSLIDEDDEVHDAVRAVILNSIEGSGLNLRLVNPVKE